MYQICVDFIAYTHTYINDNCILQFVNCLFLVKTFSVDQKIHGDKYKNLYGHKIVVESLCCVEMVCVTLTIVNCIVILILSYLFYDNYYMFIMCSVGRCHMFSRCIFFFVLSELSADFFVVFVLSDFVGSDCMGFFCLLYQSTLGNFNFRIPFF